MTLDDIMPQHRSQQTRRGKSTSRPLPPPSDSYYEPKNVLIRALHIEQFKTKLLTSLLEQHTSLRASDIFTGAPNGTEQWDLTVPNNSTLHVYTSSEAKSAFKNIHLHGTSSVSMGPSTEQTRLTASTQSTSTKKTKSGSTVKKTINNNSRGKVQASSDQTSNTAMSHSTKRRITRAMVASRGMIARLDSEESHEEEIKCATRHIQSIRGTEPEYSAVYNYIDSEMAKIPNTTSYTPILSRIRRNRKKLFMWMDLEEYKDMLRRDTERIYHAFKQKGYKTTKIRMLATKSLTALESRLIRYGDYTKQFIEVDDIQDMQKKMYLDMPCRPEYTPYSCNAVCLSLMTYGSVFSTVRELLKTTLLNKYGFHNIMYLPLPSSKETDRYSYYTLDRISDGKRMWMQDTRLENTVLDIISQVLPYLVQLFRRIYFDVFSDNRYRPESMWTMHQITECDCTQIAHNIFTLARPNHVSTIARDLIATHATRRPTHNDVFNMIVDDTLQRERMLNDSDGDGDPSLYARRMFDDITSEEMDEFYRKHQ